MQAEFTIGADDLRRQLARERRQWRTERRALLAERRRLRRTVLQQPSVAEALTLAAIVYGVPRASLERVAWCESRHQPTARNGPYLGLFQWGPPAWSSTPFAALSPYSAYAAALATAHRVRAHGWGWWECKP